MSLQRVPSGQSLRLSSASGPCARPAQSPSNKSTSAPLRKASSFAERSLRSDVAAWQALRSQRLVGFSVLDVPASVTASQAAEPPAASSASAEAAAPPAPAPVDAADVSACDIRVGRILQCDKHPDADSLYVEQIDVGEPEPRTIVSGLVEFVPLEQMQGRQVVVICNLKPRNMRGVKSNGMVLCASNSTHDKVEPLDPPAGAAPGERVWFGEGNQGQPAPAEPNRVQKKKIWEAVQPLLCTDSQGVAGFKGAPMLTSAGPVKAASLTSASIS